MWPDGYYASYNMFNVVTGAFLGSQACALDPAWNAFAPGG
jgi:hypothetical protein